MKNDVMVIVLVIVLVLAILFLVIPGSQEQLDGAENISHVAIERNWFSDLFGWLMCWEGSEVCYAQ